MRTSSQPCTAELETQKATQSAGTELEVPPGRLPHGGASWHADPEYKPDYATAKPELSKQDTIKNFDRAQDDDGCFNSLDSPGTPSPRESQGRCHENEEAPLFIGLMQPGTFEELGSYFEERFQEDDFDGFEDWDPLLPLDRLQKYKELYLGHRIPALRYIKPDVHSKFWRQALLKFMLGNYD